MHGAHSALLYAKNIRLVLQLISLQIFTSAVFASEQEFRTVTLAWDAVPQADLYRLVEKLPDTTVFVEKAMLSATENSYSFDLPLPEVNDTHVYTYKVIGCVVNPENNETLCESVSSFSEPYQLNWRYEGDFTAVAIKLSYQYDALGRLIKVTDPENGDRDYDYDPAGNRDFVTDHQNGSQ